MPPWIVYCLASSLVVVLYGFFGPTSIRAFYGAIVHRNPQWVAGNTDFRQRYPAPRYTIWLFYLAGLAWLAFLAHAFFIAKATPLIAASLLTPALPFVLIYLSYVIVEYFRVFKQVPLPARRTTLLERRALQDMMNPLWVYAGYLLLAVIVGAYVIAYLNHVVATGIFFRRLTGLSVVAASAAVLLLITLRRKRQPVDDLVGRGYRRLELIGGVTVLYLAVLTGAWRLSQDVFAFHRMPDLYVFVALNVFSQLAALYLLVGMPFLPRRPSDDATGGDSSAHLGVRAK